MLSGFKLQLPLALSTFVLRRSDSTACQLGRWSHSWIYYPCISVKSHSFIPVAIQITPSVYAYSTTFRSIIWSYLTTFVVNKLYLLVAVNKVPWINNSTVFSPYLLGKSIKASTEVKHCKFPHTRKETVVLLMQWWFLLRFCFLFFLPIQFMNFPYFVKVW